ncbi:MAG: hypothetical protein N3E45_16000 [Oscillatoriaceae bacterium SKW80]|nr:hypothetical protein [Oscillatoriaceae bacterium SKYG93]MCX8122301.1 hypothetical protein [Oscillatoriaceae bacterium SKW80]MDW8452516.1 hypothetical protein [Oscillatoriaceae cyanobacterium SKYGB_i_bin93]HIK29638.1 hypothetical protein [Oscillatoriaceae cyanobacterium M7585_C2015_266]
MDFPETIVYWEWVLGIWKWELAIINYSQPCLAASLKEFLEEYGRSPTPL